MRNFISIRQRNNNAQTHFVLAVNKRKLFGKTLVVVLVARMGGKKRSIYPENTILLRMHCTREHETDAEYSRNAAKENYVFIFIVENDLVTKIELFCIRLTIRLEIA